jgi:site-specific recombinase XerD
LEGVDVAKLAVVAPTPTTALQRLVEDFLAHCRAKGNSPKTMEAYSYPLRGIFLPFCAKEGVGDAAEITPRLLNRLSAQLLSEGGKRGPLSKHTVHSYLRPVNHFLNWAREDGIEVTGKAQLPKLPRKLLDILSRDEIAAVEEAATSERDQLIVRVMADTGIRVGELVRLHVGDLIGDRNERYLKIRGKGDKERRVPLAPKLAMRLRTYIDRRRPKDAQTDRLFVSLRRRPTTGEFAPLTESGVQQLVRNLGLVAELDKNVHPHLLRHSYATWALQKGVNPLIVKDILGHADMTMITNTYSHLTSTDAYEATLRLLMEE